MANFSFGDNGKLHCQTVTALVNGTFESFCINDGYFTTYSLIVRNDTSLLMKRYDFSSVEIKNLKIIFNDYQGCAEILEIDYYPGFIISRNEYIMNCSIQTNSFEANYYLNKNRESSGRYIYPSTNFLQKKTDRTKIGEWKYYDLNNIIKKIVNYDEIGNIVGCKGECD